MARKKAEVVVIGGGPGGYAAAFHAADLGKKVVLIEEQDRLGGVCLNVGCIPSKALLHVAEVIEESGRADVFGVQFQQPKIDLDKMRSWKDGVVGRLTGGLAQLAKSRNVDRVQARAKFSDSSRIAVEGAEDGEIEFESAVIATGSRPTVIPHLAGDRDRVMDSTGALDLKEVPKKLLVIGGGYIGLELGTVYAALGSKVTVVEMLDGLLPGVDRDLVKPLQKRLKELFEAIHLNTKVASLKETKSGVTVELEGAEQASKKFDQVLVAVGRSPNVEDLGLEEAGVHVEDGFIRIDAQCRTSRSNIFAIGDVAGQPMLAHKAMREGKVAAEALAGQQSEFDNRAIPAVVFTSPEIAWSGLTESEAEKKGVKVKVARFPWAAASRALTLGWSDGLTKMLFEPDTGRVVGVGMVGPNAGELVAEGTLAIEMAAVAEDLALTIHSHPTLSETVGEVAEVFLGHATHIFRK